MGGLSVDRLTILSFKRCSFHVCLVIRWEGVINKKRERRRREERETEKCGILVTDVEIESYSLNIFVSRIKSYLKEWSESILSHACLQIISYIQICIILFSLDFFFWSLFNFCALYHRYVPFVPQRCG